MRRLARQQTSLPEGPTWQPRSISLCFALQVCDQSLLTFAEEEEETVVVEEEVVDEEPPTIELNLGDGQVQETQLADGSTLSVIVHQYVVTRDENIWSDPGWTVVDNFDPPTSIKKSAQGAGAVTTAYPTRT